MNDQYEMPETDAAMLRTMVGIGVIDELPAKLTEKYWELKRCMDRLGARMSPNDLAWLCFLGGFGKPNAHEKAGPSVAELFKKKKLKHGDRVKTIWRDQPAEGALQGVNGNGEVLILLDGQVDVRTFAADEVRVLEMAA